jgi:hypothetical protein
MGVEKNQFYPFRSIILALRISIDFINLIIYSQSYDVRSSNDAVSLTVIAIPPDRRQRWDERQCASSDELDAGESGVARRDARETSGHR